MKAYKLKEMHSYINEIESTENIMDEEIGLFYLIKNKDSQKLADDGMEPYVRSGKGLTNYVNVWYVFYNCG